MSQAPEGKGWHVPWDPLAPQPGLQPQSSTAPAKSLVACDCQTWEVGLTWLQRRFRQLAETCSCSTALAPPPLTASPSPLHSSSPLPPALPSPPPRPGPDRGEGLGCLGSHVMGRGQPLVPVEG